MVAGRGDAAVGGGAWWDVREDVLRRGHGEDRWGWSCVMAREACFFPCGDGPDVGVVVWCCLDDTLIYGLDSAASVRRCGLYRVRSGRIGIERLFIEKAQRSFAFIAVTFNVRSGGKFNYGM